ncbi:unnamed protein product [Boreogadus saida]
MAGAMSGAEPTEGDQRLTLELFIRQLADRTHASSQPSLFFVLFSFPRFPPPAVETHGVCGRDGDVLRSARVQGKIVATHLCSFSTTYRKQKTGAMFLFIFKP